MAVRSRRLFADQSELDFVRDLVADLAMESGGIVKCVAPVAIAAMILPLPGDARVLALIVEFAVLLAADLPACRFDQRTGLGDVHFPGFDLEDGIDAIGNGKHDFPVVAGAEIASILSPLLDDKTRLAAMGKTASEWVTQTFSIESTLDALDRVYTAPPRSATPPSA